MFCGRAQTLMVVKGEDAFADASHHRRGHTPPRFPTELYPHLTINHDHARTLRRSSPSYSRLDTLCSTPTISRRRATFTHFTELARVHSKVRGDGHARVGSRGETGECKGWWRREGKAQDEGKGKTSTQREVSIVADCRRSLANS